MNSPRKKDKSDETNCYHDQARLRPPLVVDSNGLVLDFVCIYNVSGVDGNIAQTLSAVDKFDMACIKA